MSDYYDAIYGAKDKAAAGKPHGWIHWFTPCSHCFCEEHYKPEHRQCCKCRTEMHVQFIPQLTRPEPE